MTLDEKSQQEHEEWRESCHNLGDSLIIYLGICSMVVLAAMKVWGT